jgi:hypothetical protein
MARYVTYIRQGAPECIGLRSDATKPEQRLEIAPMTRIRSLLAAMGTVGLLTQATP